MISEVWRHHWVPLGALSPQTVEDHKLPRSAVAPARWGRHSSHPCEINIELHLISHLTQVRRYMMYIISATPPQLIINHNSPLSQTVPSATFHCQWKQVKRFSCGVTKRKHFGVAVHKNTFLELQATVARETLSYWRLSPIDSWWPDQSPAMAPRPQWVLPMLRPRGLSLMGKRDDLRSAGYSGYSNIF